MEGERDSRVDVLTETDTRGDAEPEELVDGEGEADEEKVALVTVGKPVTDGFVDGVGVRVEVAVTHPVADTRAVLESTDGVCEREAVGDLDTLLETVGDADWVFGADAQALEVCVRVIRIVVDVVPLLENDGELVAVTESDALPVAIGDSDPVCVPSADLLSEDDELIDAVNVPETVVVTDTSGDAELDGDKVVDVDPHGEALIESIDRVPLVELEPDTEGLPLGLPDTVGDTDTDLVGIVDLETVRVAMGERVTDGELEAVADLEGLLDGMGEALSLANVDVVGRERPVVVTVRDVRGDAEGSTVVLAAPDGDCVTEMEGVAEREAFSVGTGDRVASGVPVGLEKPLADGFALADATLAVALVVAEVDSVRDVERVADAGTTILPRGAPTDAMARVMGPSLPEGRASVIVTLVSSNALATYEEGSMRNKLPSNPQ